MVDLIRFQGRGSHFAALAVAALTMFALVLVATPASAADPVSAENFHPDPPIAGPMHLTDRPDGSSTSDTTAHVTTVTTPDAAVVEYHLCDDFTDTGAAGPAANSGEAGDAEPDSDPNLDGDCFKVGEDTTGVIPSPGPAGAGRTFELDFDIPAAQEDLAGTTEFVAWICTSAATRTDTNCDNEVEDDIIVDDSSTPANPPAQSTAGAITFPPHGSSISNEGFTATASTSPDVTLVRFCLGMEAGGSPATDAGNADEGATADGDGDPGGCHAFIDVVSPDNPVSQQGTFKTWSATFNEAQVVDNAEYALVLFKLPGGGGAGVCTGGDYCQLDSNYIVSALSTPTEIAIDINDRDDCPISQPDPDDATQPYTTSRTEMIGEGNPIDACIIDQSGNDVTNNFHWALQATPDSDAGATTTEPAGFFNCDSFDANCDPDEGDNQDLNSNSFFEIVDGDPGDSLGDWVDHDFFAKTPGTWTITFCLDSNNDAEAANPAQSSTPCAGEALTASATKNMVAEIDHVHVKRQDQTDALCHTGSSTTTAPAGTALTLRGCVLGLTGSTGNEVPVSGVHVLWITNPAARPDDPGQITTQTNVSDANGHATAQITSGANAGDKTSTFRFCLDEFPATGGALQGNGICDVADAGSGASAGTQADYQVNWIAPAQGVGCPAGFNRIRGNNENNLLVGTAGCDKIKARGGNDTSRGKASNDVLNGGKGRDKGNGGPGIDRCVKTERKRRCES